MKRRRRKKKKTLISWNEIYYKSNLSELMKWKKWTKSKNERRLAGKANPTPSTIPSNEGLHASSFIWLELLRSLPRCRKQLGAPFNSFQFNSLPLFHWKWNERAAPVELNEFHSLFNGWFMNWLVFVFVLFPLAEPCGAAATNPPNERKTKPISSFINRAALPSAFNENKSTQPFTLSLPAPFNQQ